MNKRVGVLMGGPSSERDISIRSGRAVCQALKNSRINAVPVELIKASTMNGYKELVMKKIRSSHIDIAFITLHGEFGEDGTIQKILEEMDIPYTGSGIDASRLGMDKISSRKVFKLNNIPIPRYKVIVQGEALDSSVSANSTTSAKAYFKKLGSPLVIKPSNGGSSIGLSIVDSERYFTKALSKAFRYSHNVIIEQYIRGREITVGILEDRALPIVEIIPKRRFFDFEAKYEKGITEYIVPAEIDKTRYEACQSTALLAHRALGARFFSRVDMILSQDGHPVVLELNTIPGLTEASLLPKAAEATGIDFNQLVFKILESALW